MLSTALQLLYSREEPGAENWVGLGTGLDGTENLTSTEMRSPDRPGHGRSLYSLRYPGR
jgi:hypothetical protein